MTVSKWTDWGDVGKDHNPFVLDTPEKSKPPHSETPIAESVTEEREEQVEQAREEVTREVDELRYQLQQAINSLPQLADERETVRDLQALKQELDALEKSFLVRIGSVLAHPVEAYGGWKEKKKQEAYDIPDNPKLIAQLTKILGSDFEKFKLYPIAEKFRQFLKKVEEAHLILISAKRSNENIWKTQEENYERVIDTLLKKTVSDEQSLKIYSLMTESLKTEYAEEIVERMISRAEVRTSKHTLWREAEVLQMKDTLEILPAIESFLYFFEEVKQKCSSEQLLLQKVEEVKQEYKKRIFDKVQFLFVRERPPELLHNLQKLTLDQQKIVLRDWHIDTQEWDEILCDTRLTEVMDLWQRLHWDFRSLKENYQVIRSLITTFQPSEINFVLDTLGYLPQTNLDEITSLMQAVLSGDTEVIKKEALLPYEREAQKVIESVWGPREVEMWWKGTYYSDAKNPHDVMKMRKDDSDELSDDEQKMLQSISQFVKNGLTPGEKKFASAKNIFSLEDGYILLMYLQKAVDFVPQSYRSEVFSRLTPPHIPQRHPEGSPLSEVQAKNFIDLDNWLQEKHLHDKFYLSRDLSSLLDLANYFTDENCAAIKKGFLFWKNKTVDSIFGDAQRWLQLACAAGQEDATPVNSLVEKVIKTRTNYIDYIPGDSVISRLTKQREYRDMDLLYKKYDLVKEFFPNDVDLLARLFNLDEIETKALSILAQGIPKEGTFYDLSLLEGALGSREITSLEDMAEFATLTREQKELYLLFSPQRNVKKLQKFQGFEKAPALLRFCKTEILTYGEDVSGPLADAMFADIDFAKYIAEHEDCWKFLPYLNCLRISLGAPLKDVVSELFSLQAVGLPDVYFGRPITTTEKLNSQIVNELSLYPPEKLRVFAEEVAKYFPDPQNRLMELFLELNTSLESQNIETIQLSLRSYAVGEIGPLYKTKGLSRTEVSEAVNLAEARKQKLLKVVDYEKVKGSTLFTHLHTHTAETFQKMLECPKAVEFFVEYQSGVKIKAFPYKIFETLPHSVLENRLFWKHELFRHREKSPNEISTLIEIIEKFYTLGVPLPYYYSGDALLDIYHNQKSLLEDENLKIFGYIGIVRESSWGEAGTEQRKEILRYFSFADSRDLDEFYLHVINKKQLLLQSAIRLAKRAHVKIPFELLNQDSFQSLLLTYSEASTDEQIDDFISNLDKKPVTSYKPWFQSRAEGIISPEIQKKIPHLYKECLADVTRPFLQVLPQIESMSDELLARCEKFSLILETYVSSSSRQRQDVLLNDHFLAIVSHANFETLAHILQQSTTDYSLYSELFSSCNVTELTSFLDTLTPAVAEKYIQFQPQLSFTLEEAGIYLCDESLAQELALFLQKEQIQTFLSKGAKKLSLADAVLLLRCVPNDLEQETSQFILGFSPQVIQHLAPTQFEDASLFLRISKFIVDNRTQIEKTRNLKEKMDLPFDELLSIVESLPKSMRFAQLFNNINNVEWIDFEKAHTRLEHLGISRDQRLDLEAMLFIKKRERFSYIDTLMFERFFEISQNNNVLVVSLMKRTLEVCKEQKLRPFLTIFIEKRMNYFLQVLKDKDLVTKCMGQISPEQKLKMLHKCLFDQSLAGMFFENEILIGSFQTEELHTAIVQFIPQASFDTLVQACNRTQIREALKNEDKNNIIDRALALGNFDIALKWAHDLFTHKEEQEKKTKEVRNFQTAGKKVGVGEGEHEIFFSMYKSEKFSHDISPKDIDACRQRILDEKYADENALVRKSYNEMLVYLNGEDDAKNILWKYMGTKNKHDMLGPVHAFLNKVKNIETKVGGSRKKTVLKLLQLGGMGTGLQAEVCKDIMEKINSDLWIEMEASSVYEGEEPPLKNIHHMNLMRIKNEIRLLQMPEILETIKRIPQTEAGLKSYALHLIQHTNINVDAVHKFVTNPREFFNSRSGAGETDVVAMLLTELSPGRYPNWNETDSRDALVEGGYDTINSFPARAVEWHENQRVLDLEAKVYAALFPEQANMDVAKVVEMVQTDFTEGIQDFDKDTLEKVAELRLGLRQDMFLEYMDEGNNYILFVEHAKAKGKDIVNKAYDFLQKRELSDIDGLLKRAEAKPDRDEQKQQALIAELKGQREQIVQKILKQKSETNIFLQNIDAGVDNLRTFWESIFQTGFLDKSDLTAMIKRITKEQYENEAAWMTTFAGQNLGAHTALEQRVSSMMQAVRSNSSVTWYQMEVLRPSDPVTATAGSTTGQCDAFGHGKKSHFMVNPGTAQMVIRESRSGRPREWKDDHIVGQSTLTTDKRIFKSWEERRNFFNAMYRNSGKISESLATLKDSLTAQELLDRYSRGDDQITLDSVETPPNIRGRISKPEMHRMLQKGFQNLAKNERRYGVQIIAGTQFSYMEDESLPHVPNDATWLTPIAYSDNSHDRQKAVLIQKADTAQGREETPGVRPARPDDAFVIALMEDIAFSRSGGSNYIKGFLHMSRELNASCLHAERAQSKPLSFIDVSKKEDGTVQYNGYLIAFEQRANEIYITDTASTGQEKGVGTRLLFNLLESVATDSKLNKKTITMDCRGATSAKAVAKPSNREIIESLEFTNTEGKKIKFRVNGPKFENIQGDSLYPFRFEPYEVAA